MELRTTPRIWQLVPMKRHRLVKASTSNTSQVNSTHAAQTLRLVPVIDFTPYPLRDIILSPALAQGFRYAGQLDDIAVTQRKVNINLRTFP